MPNRSLKPFRPIALALAAATALTGALAAPAEAAELPGDLQIVEGHGVGDVIGLGQSRASVIETLDALGANNGNCDYADSCSFRLSGDTAAVTAHFTSGDQVELITVVQGGVALDKRWETTAGVVDGMSATEVAALYPSSTLTTDNDGSHVVVAESGYTYHWSGGCYATGCSFRSWHEIYVPAGEELPDGSGLGLTGGYVGTTPEFQGTIIVFNDARKGSDVTLRLTVTDPEGNASTYTDSVYAPANNYVRLDPADYLSTDGPLGLYHYTAELLSGHGKKPKVIGSTNAELLLVLV